jgi:hypothetical protein
LSLDLKGQRQKRLFKHVHHVHVVYVAVSHILLIHAQQNRLLIKLVFKVLIDKLVVVFRLRY